MNKELYDDLNVPVNLPTANQRFTNFNECKKQGFIDIVPYMVSVTVEYTFGNEVVYKDETQPVLAAAHVAINSKLVYNLVCNLMMELNLVFRVKVHSK